MKYIDCIIEMVCNFFYGLNHLHFQTVETDCGREYKHDSLFPNLLIFLLELVVVYQLLIWILAKVGYNIVLFFIVMFLISLFLFVFIPYRRQVYSGIPMTREKIMRGIIGWMMITVIIIIQYRG